MVRVVVSKRILFTILILISSPARAVSVPSSYVECVGPKAGLWNKENDPTQ